MKRTAGAFVSIVFLATGSVWAIPVIGEPLPGGFLDVQYFAGSGPNTAYFVVDFGATGGGTYAFGYHWDASQMPTPVDGFYSITTAAGRSLTMETDPPIDSSGPDPQTNYFVDEFKYLNEDDAPDNNSRSWYFYLGNPSSQSVNWTVADFGISAINSCGKVVYTLGNGDFLGFRADEIDYDNNFNPTGATPALPVTTLEPGDFNLDGHVDTSDVSAMLKAMADLNAYQNGSNSQQATLTESDLLAIGDLNGDGKITNADLQDLLNLLKSGHGSMESVPEPAAWVLASCAAICALAIWRRGYVRRGWVCSSA